MSGPIDLYLNGVLMNDDHGLEWGWTTGETLGGQDSASLVVQDRDNTLEPEQHWDVKMIIASSGHVLWRGEITNAVLELPDKFPWRRWALTCQDYNGEAPFRLVGAFDGKTWIDSSGLGVFVNIDPYASTLETDKLTVQAWFDHYFRVNGEAVDTDTYVNQYIDHVFQQDFDYSNLQTALESLASLVAANLQFWIDPDLAFHWVTIPAWQDLAQVLVGLSGDPATSAMAMMLPEGSPSSLAFASHNISDIGTEDSDVGFSRLKIEFDGSDMPEQVYVKGSTGYVYNAPPIPPTEETKTTVQAPTAGAADRYELTFLATTKLWHTDATGYVSTSYDTCGPSGPYEVKYVSVAWSVSRNKGGHYWKLLEGPNSGKLVDNDTNVLNGYGSIRVQKVVEVPGQPGEPVVGIGGSGWTYEVDQDPSKRQTYLEAPLSSDAASRDAIGGQALYRGMYPTLRGSVIVRGYDGWRVGQVVRIEDARLPSSLNGRYFVIQAVKCSPIAGQDYREYTINFGDGPESRYTYEKQPSDVSWPPPFIQIDVQAFDLTPGPSSTQRITAQLVNGSGEPWAVAGKVVNWSFECYNNLGVLQTGQGSINPEVSITDKNGRAYTKLTTGAGTNLVYYVFANVKVT